jgi:predicted RNA-binding protein associated with RNAse of E/G family
MNSETENISLEEEYLLTLAIVLCNRATGISDDDELAEQLVGLTSTTAFDKCMQWIDQICKEGAQTDGL